MLSQDELSLECTKEHGTSKTLSILALPNEINLSSVPIPLFMCKVQAGFPSPADDYIECKLDLNELTIKHPAATYFIRAQGDSMADAGIQSGDLLIVDRSLTPSNGKIVIAALDGELTLKHLQIKNGKMKLIAANPNYPPIDITESMDMVIWGVVTFVLHQTA